MNRTQFVLLGLACFALACGDDGRGRGGDTGIVVMDSGTSDATTGDTSTGTDSSTGSDTGTRPDGTSMCPPVMLPPPAMPVCAASTLMCLQSGMDAQMCIDADPMAMACDTCLLEDLLSCATTMGGCAQAAGDVECCAQANCAGMTGMALSMCLQTTCGTQSQAFVSCVQGSMCAPTNCFMMAGAFHPDLQPIELQQFPQWESTQLLLEYIQRDR